VVPGAVQGDPEIIHELLVGHRHTGIPHARRLLSKRAAEGARVVEIVEEADGRGSQVSGAEIVPSEDQRSQGFPLLLLRDAPMVGKGSWVVERRVPNTFKGDGWTTLALSLRKVLEGH
jgi:hypothetical protein